MEGLKADPHWVVARRRPEVSPRQIQAALDVLMAQHLNAVYTPCAGGYIEAQVGNQFTWKVSKLIHIGWGGFARRP